MYFWQKTESMNCNVCHTVDSLEHKFLHCYIAKRCWRYIRNILRIFYKDAEITERNIIFSESIEQITEQLDCETARFLTLIGKWCIHKYWITDARTPIEILIKNECTLRLQIAKYMKVKQGVLESYRKFIEAM